VTASAGKPEDPTRVLFLGNSSDLIDFGPGHGTAVKRIQTTIEEITGRPTCMGFAWIQPHPRLSARVSGMLEAFKPDVSVLHCGGFTVGAPYLGALLQTAWGGRIDGPTRRLQRTLHRVFAGRRSVDIVDRVTALTRLPGVTVAADLKTLAPEQPQPGWPYLALRYALLSAGLGRTFFSVGAAAAWFESTITTMTAGIGGALLVRGPPPQCVPGVPARLMKAGNERLAELDRRLEQSCSRQQVRYCSVLKLAVGEPERYLLHDGIHPNAKAQTLVAEDEALLLRELLGHLE